MTKHVAPAQLALFSRGDLGFWNRRGVEQHLNRCDECSRSLREFAAAQDLLANALELPPELDNADWLSLSAEMSANIRLGLAAGECISPRSVLVRRPRLALVMAGLTIAMIAFGLQRPTAAVRPLLSADTDSTTLESSENSIAVHAAGHVLSVQSPADKDVIRTVDTSGEMRSRYVDDTDGVTIVNVYAE